MNEENNHIIYTAEDIKRYLTGEMPPAQMHAMEMAALDDHLLAEAMEGYELMEQKDWSKELAALRSAFSPAGKNEAPVIPVTKKPAFKWWKAAAAVLLLGTTAVTAYLFTNQKNIATEPDLARNKSVTATDSTALNNTPAESSSAAIVMADSTPLIARLDKKTNGSMQSVVVSPVPGNNPYNDEAAKADSTFIYRPAAPAEKEYLAMKDKTRADGEVDEKENASLEEVTISNRRVTNSNAAMNNSNITVTDKNIGAKREEKLFERDSKAAGSNSFSGQVLTPDNKPVGYANINVPQSSKPVYTDANGRFTISAPDSMVSVNVSSAGYDSKYYTLKNSTAANKIVLQPQEVATVALAEKQKTASRKKAVRVDSTDLEEDEDAEPEGGWVAYDNYLTDNLQFPDDARQNNIHGEVEVTVKLKNTGEISAVKVNKSLCPQCDTEAIRLIKAGPKWDTKNNKKAEVKIKVRF